MASATFDRKRIGSTAKKELAAFLSAVEQMVGSRVIRRAADFRLATLKQIGPVNDRPEGMFRNVTIRATTQLARIAKPRCVVGYHKLDGGNTHGEHHNFSW